MIDLVAVNRATAYRPIAPPLTRPASPPAGLTPGRAGGRCRVKSEFVAGREPSSMLPLPLQAPPRTLFALASSTSTAPSVSCSLGTTAKSFCADPALRVISTQRRPPPWLPAVSCCAGLRRRRARDWVLGRGPRIHTETNSDPTVGRAPLMCIRAPARVRWVGARYEASRLEIMTSYENSYGHSLQV